MQTQVPEILWRTSVDTPVEAHLKTSRGIESGVNGGKDQDHTEETGSLRMERPAATLLCGCLRFEYAAPGEVFHRLWATSGRALPWFSSWTESGSRVDRVSLGWFHQRGLEPHFKAGIDTLSLRPSHAC